MNEFVLIIKLAVLLIGAYFLGNLHFARLISKARKDDITTHGSGNPGTMNMLRTHGIILAVFTLFLDALKGAIPALLAFYWLAPEGALWQNYAMYLAGFMAVIGHIFPIVYKFKGGKGVATAVGFFTVVNPVVSLIIFGACLIIFVVVKIGSLSSLIYISSFVIYQTITNFNVNSILPLITLYITAILIFIVHASNLEKLFKGRENKINFKQTIEKDKVYIKETKENIAKKFHRKK